MVARSQPKQGEDPYEGKGSFHAVVSISGYWCRLFVPCRAAVRIRENRPWRAEVGKLPGQGCRPDGNKDTEIAAAVGANSYICSRFLSGSMCRRLGRRRSCGGIVFPTRCKGCAAFRLCGLCGRIFSLRPASAASGDGCAAGQTDKICLNVYDFGLRNSRSGLYLLA